MLLNYQKGTLSFKDLQTIDGICEPIFQTACKSLGLLGDDKEWNQALLEAVNTTSLAQLKQLFVVMIFFCVVSEPSILFGIYWKFMYNDILLMSFKIMFCMS